MTDIAHHIATQAPKRKPRVTERRHRSPHGPGLWVTDTEIVEALGVPADVAMTAIRALDKDPRTGFPRKQKLWGDRRYWPAVKAFFDNIYGPKIKSPRRTYDE
jgi:hypothetical protein